METLLAGSAVFLRKTEEYWDLPFPIKRHHSPKSKSVILKAEIIEIKGDEFRGRLFDNNGFEKDGEVYVFHKNDLLVNQNYTEAANLGRWVL